MNKSKTAETRTGAMSNWGWSTGTSGYDDEDRLVSWTRDDNNLSQSWTLTNEGDWSQFVENTNTETRTHGLAHELTAIGSTALSYDPKGNLTVDNTKSHGYTWDFDNRMSAADTDGDNTDDVTLKYDARGRRIAKTSGTATTVYVLAGWQVVAEYLSGAAPSSPSEKYVYASYIDEPVLKDGTGGTVYYHRNSQYSVSALTSASGGVVERYGYKPYGELTILAADGSTVRASSSYGSACTYTGRRWDVELKLYYFRARYYDPGLGRFVGRDPAGYADSGNLYWSGMIVTNTDPTGLYVCRCSCVSSSGLEPPAIETDFYEIGGSLSEARVRCREQCDEGDSEWSSCTGRLVIAEHALAESCSREYFNWWYGQEWSYLARTKWTSKLPACPCRLRFRETCIGSYGAVAFAREGLRPAGFSWGNNPWLGHYHPGGKYELRAQDGAGHGQQCVYDAHGQLLTDIHGAGTADWASPLEHFWDGKHHFFDVLPWNCAMKLDEKYGGDEFLKKYLQVRPINGGKPCRNYSNAKWIP